MQNVTTFEWLTLLAILVGPVLAIIVSRFLDRARGQKDRRMDVFRTLMRTRRTPIYPEHVGALNLIEIEFADDQLVIAAWKGLLEHFAKIHPRRQPEVIDEQTSPEDRNTRNEKFYQRLYDERQRLLAKLLHAIAKKLGFRAEQLEIFEGGYTPQGWHDLELENQAIRKFVVDLYLGKRVVPVGVFDYVNLAENEPASERSVATPIQ